MLPFPPLGNLPDPGIEPKSFAPPDLQVDSLPLDGQKIPWNAFFTWVREREKRSVVSRRFQEPLTLSSEPVYGPIWQAPAPDHEQHLPSGLRDGSFLFWIIQKNNTCSPRCSRWIFASLQKSQMEVDQGSKLRSPGLSPPHLSFLTWR